MKRTANGHNIRVGREFARAHARIIIVAVLCAYVHASWCVCVYCWEVFCRIPPWDSVPGGPVPRLAWGRWAWLRRSDNRSPTQRWADLRFVGIRYWIYFASVSSYEYIRERVCTCVYAYVYVHIYVGMYLESRDTHVHVGIVSTSYFFTLFSFSLNRFFLIWFTSLFA